MTTSVPLSDGRVVTVKKKWAAQIPTSDKPKSVAKRRQAFEHLEELGQGSVIKKQMVIELGKGFDEDKLQKIAAVLDELGVHYRLSESVHHATLKSLVTQFAESGTEFDRELFGTYEYFDTTIK